MPPKSKRSKLTDSSFLFVNEDASTVTRVGKDSELDREKQSHVQRRNFARKQRLREQDTATGSDQGTVSPDTALTATAGPAATAPAPQGFFDLSSGFDDDNPYSDLDLEPLQAFDSLEQTFTSLLETPLPPTSNTAYSTGAPTRPFRFPSTSQSVQYVGSGTDAVAQHVSRAGSSTTRLSIPPRNPGTVFSGTALADIRTLLQRWAPPLIQHFNTVILPEKFFADTVAVPLSEMRHAPAIHADMRNVMSQPAHFYSFLASASAHMLAREGQLLLPDLPAGDHTRVPVFFKIKAIEALRPRLAHGMIDREMVGNVFRLMASAMCLGNYDAAEPHLQAMMSMVDSLGGLQLFDDYFTERNVLLDCCAALKRFRKPRFPLTWDPGRGPPDIAAQLEIVRESSNTLGSRMHIVIELEGLRPALIREFQDLVEVTKVARWIWVQSGYNQGHYRWLSFRRMAIAYRLLELEEGPSIQEECFRISLLFWIAVTRSPESGRRAVSRLVPTLRSRMESTNLEGLWRPHADWLLWVAVMGGVAARADDVNQEWFVDVAARCTKDLGVRNLESLEELLGGFLYEPALQRAPLLELTGRICT